VTEVKPPTLRKVLSPPTTESLALCAELMRASRREAIQECRRVVQAHAQDCAGGCAERIDWVLREMEGRG
jgi:hypothetical protein